MTPENKSEPFQLHRSSTIIDPIHGRVSFKRARNVVGHPLFQSLNAKLQLSLAKQVFPSGSGTRFPHCLGVGYITLTRLEAHPDCTPDEVQNGYLAALLHDISHWPLSHLPEAILGGHNKRAPQLVRTVLAKAISDDGGNPELVAQILEGNHWLSPLVAHHALSADRIDYTLRDADSIANASFPVFDGFISDYTKITPQDGLYVHQRHITDLIEVISTYWRQYQSIYYAPPLRVCERYAEELIWQALLAIPKLRADAEWAGDDYFLGRIGHFALQKKRSELAERYTRLTTRCHPPIGYCFSSRPGVAPIREHQQLREIDTPTLAASSQWKPEDVSLLEKRLAAELNIDPWLLCISGSPKPERWQVPKVKIQCHGGTFSTLDHLAGELESLSSLKIGVACTILVGFDTSIFESMVTDPGVGRTIQHLLQSGP